MFTLLVCAGNYTYAIHTKHIIEVIPQVNIVPVPHVPYYILGNINFSNKPIPVADLRMIISGEHCVNSMHTRIVLLQTSESKTSQFGLLAEKVTEALDINDKSFKEPSLHPASVPFLDGIANDGEEAIQLIDVDRLYAFLQYGMGA